jgi:hypothetical protein
MARVRSIIIVFVIGEGDKGRVDSIVSLRYNSVNTCVALEPAYSSMMGQS